MNVTADKLATEFQGNHNTAEEGGSVNNSAHFNTMRASLIIKGEQVHSGAGWSIRKSIQTKQYDTYFRNIYKLTPNMMRSIEWEGIEWRIKIRMQK